MNCCKTTIISVIQEKLLSFRNGLDGEQEERLIREEFQKIHSQLARQTKSSSQKQYDDIIVDELIDESDVIEEDEPEGPSKLMGFLNKQRLVIRRRNQPLGKEPMSSSQINNEEKKFSELESPSIKQNLVGTQKNLKEKGKPVTETSAAIQSGNINDPGSGLLSPIGTNTFQIGDIQLGDHLKAKNDQLNIQSGVGPTKRYENNDNSNIWDDRSSNNHLSSRPVEKEFSFCFSVNNSESQQNEQKSSKHKKGRGKPKKQGTSQYLQQKPESEEGSSQPLLIPLVFARFPSITDLNNPHDPETPTFQKISIENFEWIPRLNKNST